jgi:hypothetical protein
MSAAVRTKTVYEMRCPECGRIEEHATLSRADMDARKHDAEHEASKIVGARLGGQVFDIDGDGVPYFGSFGRAAEEAEKLGLPLVLWNGAVRPRNDCSVVICDGKDVPGLKCSRVSA